MWASRRSMLNETCCFKRRLNGPILDDIIKLGEAIRRLDDVGLRDAASTRTLVSDRKSCAGGTIAAERRGLRHS